jgi:acetylornithine deacetylase/succinyl-diaminopimelate desuccinylase-like protein
MKGMNQPVSALLGATIAAVLGMAVLFSSQAVFAATDLGEIEAQVKKQHDEGVARLQEWIRLPSIAAEDVGFPQGPELMQKMLKDAGFQKTRIIETKGKPGVFAILDAGAEKNLGVYMMYDVKQSDPSEWSSPPLAANIVDKPGMGKAVMGRGAVNQKGPQAAFLAALHAIQAVGKKLPVNIVLVAEGEEEIGSPNFSEVVYDPEVQEALASTMGVFMPSAIQDADGAVSIRLGAKGVIEVQLIASGENWGRGPGKDVHSSLKAMVDSPTWRLVKALNTLVSEDGNTITIDGYPQPRPLSEEEKAMMAAVAESSDEATMKKQLSTEHWIDDLPFKEALERLVSQPTVNIEGLVAGYTGPGGKTVLPTRAEAKLDLRLVPDMKAADALAALKAHLAKRGFGDIQVIMSGGYDSTSTSAAAPLIKAQLATLDAEGLDYVLWPRNAGSYPGYIFTGPPLNLPSGHFGLGHGSGAHAPDEYFIIESTHPKIQGWDGAVMSYVKYLYELAR